MSAKHAFRQALKNNGHSLRPQANHGSKEDPSVKPAPIQTIDQRVLRSVQHFRQEKNEVLIRYLFQIRSDLTKCLPETLQQIQVNIESMGNSRDIKQLKHLIRNLIKSKLE